MTRRPLFTFVVLASAHVAHAHPLFDEGTRLRNIAEYASSAEAFERLARESPTDEAAPRALSEAIVLRLGLGDDQRAEDDAEQFLRAYASRPDEAAKVALAMLLHASEKEDWAKVEREGARRMALIERGPLPFAMAAHATTGRAFAKHPHDGRASREYARVREMGAHAPPPANDFASLHEWARGADAYAEAIVFAADEKRDATAWAAFPALRGGEDAWIQNEVQPWVAARIAAIAALEGEYKKVIDMQPVPPPRWAVAAAARVAQMWARAADEMRVPPRASKSLKEKFEAGARLVRDARAKPAALACVALSVKYEWYEDASQACGAWLEKSHRREFPPLDELLVTPHMRDANPLRADPVRP